MRKAGLELRVGALIVVSLAMLISFIVVLGSFSLRSGYSFQVDFAFSGSIKPGAPVKVSGIQMGRIEDVEFMGGKIDPTTGRRVQVRLEVWVEDRVRDTIRQDAEFFINTAGVLGEQYLEIVPGDNHDEPPLQPGAVVLGHSPPRTDLLLARLYEVLESVSRVLTDDGELIRTLLQDSAGTVKQVNTLLTDNRESIGELITSTNQLARQAGDTLEKLSTGLGDPAVIGKTVRDADRLLVTANDSLTTLTPSINTLVTDATRATAIVTEERVDRAIAAADRAATAATKAGGLIDNVDAVVTDIRKGKGTIGALVVREEIYMDLRELIRDLGRNPWKLFWKE